LVQLDGRYGARAAGGRSTTRGARYRSGARTALRALSAALGTALGAALGAARFGARSGPARFGP